MNYVKPISNPNSSHDFLQISSSLKVIGTKSKGLGKEQMKNKFIFFYFSVVN